MLMFLMIFMLMFFQNFHVNVFSSEFASRVGGRLGRVRAARGPQRCAQGATPATRPGCAATQRSAVSNSCYCLWVKGCSARRPKVRIRISESLGRIPESPGTPVLPEVRARFSVLDR